MKNSSNHLEMTEKIFVIFTDVVDSCHHDRISCPDFITWRANNITLQLTTLFDSLDNIEIIKSIGDALFLKSTFCNPPSKENVEDLLKSLVDVFNKCKEDKPARITIHCLNDQYSHGNQLAEAISNPLVFYNTNRSLSNFIRGLRNDLFGTDINMAARIQGLVKKPTILVTEDVVKLLNLPKDSKSYEFNGCKLHHPVPITFLKGIFDYSKKNENGIESKIYIKVWELSTSTSDNIPVLSQESKQFHVLRFLNAVVDFESPDIEDVTAEIRETLIDDIYSETDRKIFAVDEKEELQEFYTDIKYRIIDFFRFSKIDFTRPSTKKDSDKQFDNFMAFREHNEDEPISSLLNTLNIISDTHGKIKCAITEKEFPNQKLSFIPRSVQNK